MTSNYEIVSGTLFVTGSLDKAADGDLQQALERYAQSTPATNRVVDMSNVRWLSPSGAKVLIAAGQDAGEKGGSMRILASRHVLQTLNLLGAKTWLTIESCMTPNSKPNAPEPEPEPAPPPPAPKATAPAAKAESASKSESASAEPPPPAPAAAPASAGTSGTMAAVGRASGALAGPHEEL